MDSDGNLLKSGETVQTESSGQSCTVVELLGAGGQGEVYRVMLGSQPFALKWYLPQSATLEQRSILEKLIEKGQPTDRFLWPIELVVSPDSPGFGYLMRLRDPTYKNIVDMMKRRIEPSFRALATAGLELAGSYFELHAKGLCYRDISFGNVFFEPDSGDVLICDNDNVTVDGSRDVGVMGTPRFMAPEVVRGEALPSTQTDLFSLAVLLFYMLMMHHPLEGRKESGIKCLDLPAMTKLYGKEPLFIFDPDDHSNAPVPDYHDNAIAFWPIYPQFLRDRFTTAFTAGIRDPKNGRVRESQWRADMVRLRDAIVYCPKCATENFYDADALKASGGARRPCWSCGEGVPLPPRLRIGKDVLVVLRHDAKLFPHHVDVSRMYDFSAPVAEVTVHPTDPTIWGLKNLSGEKWVCATAAGSGKEVAPGRSVTLAAGTRIDFGRAQGEIRV
jgi:DNA-binding helix-hairpin-helix protein with protein kinase domain